MVYLRIYAFCIATIGININFIYIVIIVMLIPKIRLGIGIGKEDIFMLYYFNLVKREILCAFININLDQVISHQSSFCKSGNIIKILHFSEVNKKDQYFKICHLNAIYKPKVTIYLKPK